MNPSVHPDWWQCAEGVATHRALEWLQTAGRAQQLNRKISQASGSGFRDLLFEARVAGHIAAHGYHVDYEYPAGVGSSTIDLRVSASQDWLIEIVSINERVCHQGEMDLEISVDGEPDRIAHTIDEVDEFYVVQRKILEKVFKHGKPTKFPNPGSSIQMILVDVRGCLSWTDGNDGLLITYGDASFNHLSPIDASVFQRGRDRAFVGLFDPANEASGSREIRSRIHCIGFIREREYSTQELLDVILLPNRNLMSPDDAKAIFNQCPLRTKASQSV